MLNQLLLTEFTLCCRKYNCTKYLSTISSPTTWSCIPFQSLSIQDEDDIGIKLPRLCFKKKSPHPIPHKHIHTLSSKVSKASKKFTHKHTRSARKIINFISTTQTIFHPPNHLHHTRHNFFWTMFFLLSFWNQAFFSFLKNVKHVSIISQTKKNTHNSFFLSCLWCQKRNYNFRTISQFSRVTIKQSKNST